MINFLFIFEDVIHDIQMHFVSVRLWNYTLSQITLVSLGTSHTTVFET